MDFLPTDSVSLCVRVAAVESIHAWSIQFQLCGLLLSTFKFTFESQISRPQEKSPWAKITKFFDYLGEKKKEKNPKKIHIHSKTKNPKQFLCLYKKKKSTWFQWKQKHNKQNQGYGWLNAFSLTLTGWKQLELKLSGFSKHLQCRTLHLPSWTFETYKEVV